MSVKKIPAALLAATLLCAFSLPAKKPLNVVFIGDSITYGVLLTKAPPSYAEDYLKHQKKIGPVSISNQGVSGYTTVNFLPSTGTVFNKTEKAAAGLAATHKGQLIFSIMLGTNDSAEDGPMGSPVSPLSYRANLKAIIDKLLSDFPDAKIVINYPIWYSPNTYNGARYLEGGLARLQRYFPEIDSLVKDYSQSHRGHVYGGNKKAFEDFKKNYLTDYTPQKGHRGTFYLHPDSTGAAKLGTYWGKAIYQAALH